MPENKPTIHSILEMENQQLKKALRTVFERQKKDTLAIDSLKIENEKLNATTRKQVTTIPELQIQNRVLQQQLKILIQDINDSENKKEDAIEKLKLFKQKFLSVTRHLRFTRAILFLTFLSMTGLIWQSYRDNESNKQTLFAFNKVSDENETLTAQNKAFFVERESFQENIRKKYLEQIDYLNNQLRDATNEKLSYHAKLSQAIENFKLQKKDLEQEHLSLLNLSKNNFENKINELSKEKKILNDHLLASEIKNREIRILEPIIKEPKHDSFMKAIQSEANEKSNKKAEQNPAPKTPSTAETNKELEKILEEEDNNNLELNKITPFKLKTSPF